MTITDLILKKQYPIKELDNHEAKTGLINSLEKGNLQKITIDSGDKLFVQTSPVDRSLKFFDGELQQIELAPKNKLENKIEPAQKPAEEITKKPGVKR